MVLLKLSQNSHENTCARLCFLIKWQAWRPTTLLKKRLWHKRFPVNFAKFLKTPFFKNTSGGCFWQSVRNVIAKLTSNVHHSEAYP